MTVPATIDLTEAQILTQLRSFLLGALPAGTPVIRGEVNRVPEPGAANFLVFWPLRQERLETNETTYADNVVVGSIAGTVLMVTAVQNGALAPGLMLVDKASLIAADTAIVSQLSGSLGGTGTYALSGTAQSVASAEIFAGQRRDLVGAEMVVQVDFHGPSSGNYVRIVESLFRSEYGVDALSSSGALAVAPLYTDAPRQMPFINVEQQFEYRWTLDVHLQANPVVGTAQQFATEVNVGVVEVAPQFTG